MPLQHDARAAISQPPIYPYLENMPSSILDRICRYLSAKSKLALRQTSSKFFSAPFRDPTFWVIIKKAQINRRRHDLYCLEEKLEQATEELRESKRKGCHKSILQSRLDHALCLADWRKVEKKLLICLETYRRPGPPLTVAKMKQADADFERAGAEFDRTVEDLRQIVAESESSYNEIRPTSAWQIPTLRPSTLSSTQLWPRSSPIPCSPSQSSSADHEGSGW